MGKKKLYEVTGTINNINIYGVNNGIIAGTVVVPEESPIAFTDNFTITPILDTNILKKRSGKFFYELKPKRGIWGTPFVAYPLNEDSLVKGSFGSKYSGFSSGGSNTKLFTSNKFTTGIICKYFFSTKPRSTQYEGLLFSCNKQPSVLIFGDEENPNSLYFISFP